MKFLSVAILFTSLAFIGCKTNGLYNYNKANLAVEGYDVLSYFQGTPLKGKAAFSTNYKGGLYYFVNKENLAQFNLDPERYIPAYGGWCAYAIGNSAKKVSINPKTFKIKDDKLLLFYNKLGINTLKKWNKQEAELSKKADKNWSEIIKLPAQ